MHACFNLCRTKFSKYANLIMVIKNLFRVVAIATITLIFASCSTPKKIAYFQDLQPGISANHVTVSPEITLKPKDKMSIVVSTQDQRLTTLFNLPILSQSIGDGTYSAARGMSGYTVDNSGDIDFPVIGKLHVQGKTREEVAAMIKNELTTRNLVKEPVVTVEFMNLTFSVLGEVKNPGRVSINKDRVTLLDALSEAGDLTIYGKRDSVMVLRNEAGVQRVYGVDLCNAKDLYSSPVYYLQQDDVVYVEPNATRARQSSLNGNTIFSTSFWFSLSSTLMSLAVLIIK